MTQLCHHWWHWTLSLCQPTVSPVMTKLASWSRQPLVPPVTTKLASWRLSVFSVWITMNDLTLPQNNTILERENLSNLSVTTKEPPLASPPRRVMITPEIVIQDYDEPDQVDQPEEGVFKLVRQVCFDEPGEELVELIPDESSDKPDEEVLKLIHQGSSVTTQKVSGCVASRVLCMAFCGNSIKHEITSSVHRVKQTWFHAVYTDNAIYTDNASNKTDLFSCRLYWQCLRNGFMCYLTNRNQYWITDYSVL